MTNGDTEKCRQSGLEFMREWVECAFNTYDRDKWERAVSRAYFRIKKQRPIFWAARLFVSRPKKDIYAF